MTKVENEWKMDMDEKLQDTILGGIISIVTDINDSFNSNDEPSTDKMNSTGIGKEQKIESIEKKQNIIIDDYCEFKIDDAYFTKKVVPQNPGSFYSYYEVKEPDTIYLDTVITIKSLLESGKSSDEFISVKAIYNNKYEYTTFSTIEEKGGSDLTYTGITSIEPLKSGRLHFIAEVPGEVESETDPVGILITVNGQSYRYNLR